MSKIEKNINREGFTLLELITVILILGVMASFVAVKFLSISAANLYSETDVIKSHLRYAQTRAMNTNSVWGINISSTTQYSLFQNGNTSNVVILPGQEMSTVTLPTGVNFSSSTLGVVSFDTWGKPYSDAAGTIPPSVSRVITLVYGGDTKSITITQNTGFIP
ncbi:MAG: prepilin-type N-terminal cleavage/methylation domain-containing protein [Smithella sp.]